jgi:dipeptide/tripeptide permease
MDRQQLGALLVGSVGLVMLGYAVLTLRSSARWRSGGEDRPVVTMIAMCMVTCFGLLLGSPLGLTLLVASGAGAVTWLLALALERGARRGGLARRGHGSPRITKETAP